MGDYPTMAVIQSPQTCFPNKTEFQEDVL